MERDTPTHSFRAGWMGAATLHTLRHHPALLREMKDHAATARALLAEHHPNASPLQKDVMRHAFVSARMAQTQGKDYTLFLGYLNETARDITHRNPPLDRAMDLYNNTVGIEVGRALRGADTNALYDALWQRMESQEFITRHDDARLAQSNYLHDDHAAGPFFERLRKICEGAYRHFPEPRSATHTIAHQGTLDKPLERER